RRGRLATRRRRRLDHLRRRDQSPTKAIRQAFRQFQYPTSPEHLSGRELSARLNASMSHLHAWRVGMIADVDRELVQR
ncbi:MAG: hypothetical protein ACRDRY_22045, partial [Pseudonocardiaceae bacterium]